MAVQETKRVSWGVLLLNMGGPSDSSEIADFLRRMFSDPYIIKLPFFLNKGLARLIAFLRAGKAAQHYAQIGGGSPLLAETEKQRIALEKALSLPIAIGMRYSRPFIQDGIQSLKERSVTHLLLLPLYPQFSLTTSQSALEHFEKTGDWNGPYQVINHHYDHPFFVSMHTEMLRQRLNGTSPALKTTVLFVAHSIPLSKIKRGDPYVQQIESTVSLISQNIDASVSWKTAFQSHLGLVKWQGPSLEEALEDLLREGVKKVIVHPLSFASENLETLFDLDIEFKKKCLDGGLDFIRVPAPGIQNKYIETLSSLVEEKIHLWELENV